VKDSDFFDQYHFRIIEFQRYHYTDNRAGVPVHYFGCLKSGWAKLTDGTTEITVHPGELFYIPKGDKSYRISSHLLNDLTFK